MPAKLLLRYLLFACCLGLLSACDATYPARTLTQQLTKLIKEEEKISATVHISGQTLWIYVPLENLVDEKNMTWDTAGLEKINQVMGIVHRVILSTDAKLNFLALVGADVKKYGLEITAIEYIPDVKEAILEKFSRGEFFRRSVKDVDFNPNAVNDVLGESKRFYNISFEQFLSLQIIHRAKTIFLKDKALQKLFEIKSSSWSEKFGVLKIDIEFLHKTYDLSQEEAKVKPLDYMRMIAAEVFKNYDFKTFQELQMTDTFSSDTIKILPGDIKNIKIKLPEILD
ncbi:MAG: hypothetical protein V1863_01590 [Candidatus Omnitrophota bacterium]